MNGRGDPSNPACLACPHFFFSVSFFGFWGFLFSSSGTLRSVINCPGDVPSDMSLSISDLLTILTPPESRPVI